MCSPHCAMVFLVVLGILTCFNIASANDCYVVAPNVLRVGSKEHLSVVVEGQQQNVAVTLREHSGPQRTLFTWNGVVTSGASKIVDVTWKEDVLHAVDLNGTSNFYVVLNVKCGSQSPMETQLLVSPATANHIFIQTDKPIYHPKSKVRIRLISLDERLRPLQKNITLQLKNPQEIVVQEHIISPWNTPIFSGEFDLPERTMLGEWTIVALHGYKNHLNYTTTFKVDKYVLPRFSVDVRTEKPYILEDTESVEVSATAKFVNKQNVQGYAIFRFGVKYDTSQIEWVGRSQQPKQLKDGTATFSLKKGDFRGKYTDQQWLALHRGHAKLVIEANVTEDATEAKESGLSDQCVFSTSPYVISLEDNQRTFKPGVNLFILAKVSYLTGDPAKGVHLILKANGSIVRDAEKETNEHGLASFLMEIPETTHSVITVQIETASRRLPEKQRAKATTRLEPYKTPRNGFIAIQRNDPMTPVKVDREYSAVLFTNLNAKFGAYYTVISKGRVLFTAELKGGTVQKSISFQVTEDMVPSFRVVAFAKVRDIRTNTLTVLSDSIYVRTERSCDKNSKTEVLLEDKETEPGTAQTITIKGEEGTVVGLLGVDKAVYLLHKKGLLTFDKVFSALESKDLGCGMGGGVDTNEAILKSGVVVLSRYLHPTRRNDLSCHERHRRRREATQNIAEEYEDPGLRNCCEHGIRRDPYHKTCDVRVQQLQEIVQPEKQADLDCIAAYQRCCLFREEKDEEAGGIMARSFSDIDSIYPDNMLGPVNDRDVRKDFRDTWLFDTVIIGASHEAKHETTLPDSITTWELGAVSVSPRGGICVASPAEITTFKPVFIEMNLPYSVVQNEQIEVPVTLYNYGKEELKAKVFLQGTRGICSSAIEGEISPIQKIKVPKGSGRTVVFPIVPLETGDRYIQASAFTTNGADSARVRLRVEPPGKPAKKDITLVLDPLNERKRKQRSVSSHEYKDTISDNTKTQLVALKVPDLKNAVPGTEHCELSVIGDKLGQALEIAISDPAHLVRIPTGCGEQTMIYLAPTLYTYGYLKASNKITGKSEDKALDAMRKGYARILTYRQPNGAYAAWLDRKASQWLTAFVVKNLCEARKWIRVDEHAVTSALAFLISKQNVDGSFVEDSPVVHTEMLGGVKAAVPMTAFVMMAFSECINDGVQVDKLNVSNARAAAYLDRNLRPSSEEYTLALAAYAFAVGNNPSRSKVLQYLKNVASYAEGTNMRHIPAPTQSLTIEATAYALMSLVNEGSDRDYIESFVNWMNKRFRPTGSSSSTQDTVVGLQALAKYAIYSKEDLMDITCDITLSSDRNFNQTIRIKRDNSHIANRIQVPHRPGADVFLTARGKGTANVMFTTSYNVAAGKDELCKFDLHVNFTELSMQETLDYRNQTNRKLRNKKPYRMNVCARASRVGDTGMAIIDVGILSGFSPDPDDLEKIQTKDFIDAFETSNRAVVFYLKSIPHDKEVCLQFHVIRQYIVGNMQSSYVRVYSYYDVETACTQFYAPDSASPLLKTRCENTGVCRCAEGGCPLENPLKKFMEDPQAKLVGGNGTISRDTQRELLREFACDKADFVWIGTIEQQKPADGFFNIGFRVNRTLKQGYEDDLNGQVRRLKIRDRCHQFKSLKPNKRYILMAPDSEIQEEIEGVEQIVYHIDQSSLLFEKERRMRAEKQLVNWFVGEFEKNKGEYCPS
ncbi:A.superbus venom factor 1-like [Ornithodoros turicata]|uniref:A.superbus venom factor 1-like n=1 Tax=Ornithodoros turicata TaxID=34597 RepID=UPI003139EC20